MFLVKGLVRGSGEVLQGCGTGSDISRDGSEHMGENGYQAWAIMSPYGSSEMEGTY